MATLQCIQTLSDHTDVVMSVLCWDQFLLSCSLDQTIKVSPHLRHHFVEQFHKFIYLSILGNSLVKAVHGSNIYFGAGLGSYREWKFRSNIYAQRRSGTRPYTSTVLIVACLLCYYSLYCDPLFQLKLGANLSTSVPQGIFF